jgi:pilus assembly protein CpaE
VTVHSGRRVRLLCGVADPDTARALTGLLDQLPGTEAAPALPDSASLLDSLARAAETGLHELPEVVVVHDRLAPTPALEVVREISLRFPAVGVVLLTAEPSPAVLSGAMDSGARGVAGLPLSYDELAARVEAAAAWAAGVRRHLTPPGGSAPVPPGGAGGALVAVAGAKGGVGTTVTAVQLALAACAAGRTVALVDMDLQGGDVASYLDVQFRRSVADLADIGDISSRVLQDAMYVHEAGPALLIAPAEGERGEEVTDRSARQILYALRQRYELVVVDCGTQMSSANAVAVETAETAVLITTPDVVAVRAAKRMVRMWDRLRIRKPLNVTVAVNRWTRGAEIQPSLVGRITGTRMAVAVVPAAYRELQPVVDAGRLHDLDNRSTVKQGVQALAAELGLTERASAAPAAQKALGRAMRKALGGGEGDRGQVVLETLGMTPLIVITLILIWQAVLAGYTFTLAGDAADEAARAAAVGRDAATAANADLPGAWACGGCVSTAVSHGVVTATVNLRVPVLFPGAIGFPFTVPGHASAVDEEPVP